MGATFDLAGRPATEEAAAESFGFVDVEAFRTWKLNIDKGNDDNDNVRWLVFEVCNLKSEIKNLKKQVSSLDRRLTGTGTELIG